MQAESIRNKLSPTNPQDEIYWTMGCAIMLREIAAQLAELNEAQKPRWVELNRGDGIAIFVDATRIRSVQSYHTGEKETCIVNDDWSREHMIFEPLATVMKKLGIVAE